MCGNAGGAQKAGGSNCCHFTPREPVKLNRCSRRCKARFTGGTTLTPNYNSLSLIDMAA